MIERDKKRKDLRILLLQFRVAKEMREQEVRCYLKFGKLNKNQVVAHYLLEEDFDVESLKDYDAVIIGGTGDFGSCDIREKYLKAYKKLEKIAHYCKKNKIPALSICLQVWAAIDGGEVKTDGSRQEVGTFVIKLTEEGKKDVLFEDMPREFKAQVGHKDYVSKIPKGAVLLAYSDLCPTHAYRVGDREYFLQFHIDLDKKSVVERIKFYGHEGYAPEDPEELKKLFDSIEETPESTGLLEKWVDRIVFEK
jgi:GMP synthase (glutamine-hydrolysing)